MSRSTIRNQLKMMGSWLLDPIPGAPSGTSTRVAFATGTWFSPWVNIDEQRRLNVTIGIGSATGAVGDIGGMTGVLVVQGTDEIANCYGGTGTPDAGMGSRPGQNGYTGALFSQQLQTARVNNTTTSIGITFTDIGTAFVRLAFNPGIPTAIGSGSMFVHLTGKGA
jgi:hypothetical protein